MRTASFRRPHPTRSGASAAQDLAGNDDLGQMSAWLLFTALGFYPVTPGSGEYVIGRPFVDRVFNRPIEYLGCTRQFSNSNWKLYLENVKDPYHASLLHLFHTTFNIFRVGMKAHCTTDGQDGLHSIILAINGPDPVSLKGAASDALLAGALDPLRRRDTIDGYAAAGLQALATARQSIKQASRKIAYRAGLEKMPNGWKPIP